MWPDIIEAVPDATLDIFYGWETFDVYYANNAERMAWKDSIMELTKQEGITFHGRVGQDVLREFHGKCGIFSYPTWFSETFCISAVECQAAGCVPVTMNLAALAETVGCGEKIYGDIYMPETKEEYKRALIGLMKDEERWKLESAKGIEFAKKFTWEKVGKDWINHLR
jgi:glycosyltransferase involved in cell wall biosynthesis